MYEEGAVAHWFADQHIFITGGTGFLGKVLIEKLLRACPNVASVILIVRPKKGKTPQERIDRFLQAPLFDKLKQVAPNAIKKLKVIAGDVSRPNLDLSNDDLAFLRQNVTCIFNSAACVRFDQPLLDEIKGNTKGTLALLELASTFQYLRVFVQVSTAYCHCARIFVEERWYRAPRPPQKIIEMSEMLDEDIFEAVAPKLLENDPNSYTYTKNLAEDLVGQFATQFTVVIARPSIVTGVWKEPLPGWVDSVNGLGGFTIAAGKGILHTLHADRDIYSNVVPVDVVANGLILSAWRAGTSTKTDQPFVVNLTASKDNRLRWGEVLDVSRAVALDVPFKELFFYPVGSFRRNYYVNYVFHVLFHLLPAILADFILGLFGRKPFVYDLQTKVYDGVSRLSYFLTHSFHFETKNMAAITATLSTRDKAIFFTDTSDINWTEFYYKCFLGLKLYILKEKMEDLPKARSNLTKHFVVYLTMCSIFWGSLLWISYKLFCPAA